MINPTSNALNYVVIAGVASPGKAVITGASIPYKWDVQSGYGASGAYMIYHGRDVARFTLTISIWESQHFAEWEIFKKLLEPPTPFKPLVVEMSHPILANLNIVKVAIEKVGAMERQSNGIWMSTIECLEYRPMLPAITKPHGAVPAAAEAAAVTPQTAAQRALVEQSAKLEAAVTAARTP